MSNIKMCDCGESTYSYKCSLCIADKGLFSKPQPKQEPVGHGGRSMTLRECMEAEEQIYKREWVGLPLVRVLDLWRKHQDVRTFYREIEAELKEKNT